MKYINNDLDFIFIRAKNKQNKWGSISVRNLDKQQWEEYLINKFGNGKQFWKSANSQIEKEEWTDNDKLNMLNWLAERGAVFCMIARGKARKNYKS